MSKRVRLLPILIIFAFLAFGAKVGGLWSDAERVLAPFTVQGAIAQETDEDPFAEADGEGAADGEAGTESGSDTSDDAALADPGEEQPSGSAASGQIFTESEVRLLQDLAARREQLEARSRELDIRESLLEAAERRIEDKIAELREIEAKIDALITQHDAQEERKLRSLVRVYETMKPKDAAVIFNELDLDILLDVVELMNERRIAPILAEMDPQRATTVTTELRTRKKLPETLEGARADTAAAAPPPPAIPTENGQDG